MDFSKLLQDLSKLFYVFFALCQTKPSRSMTWILKLNDLINRVNERNKVKILNSLGPLIEYVYLELEYTKW